MCLYSSESNEQMEPNDNEFSGHARQDNVSSSTSDDVNHEQGAVQKDGSSPNEAPLPSPSISLVSCESFASNSSEYSVDVNSYVDKLSSKDNGSSECIQEDPRYRLYNVRESSFDLKENQNQGENGFNENLDSDSYGGSTDDSTSSDEFSDEADEPSTSLFERDEIWDPPGAEDKNDDEANSMTILDDDDDDEDDDESANADVSEWAMPRLKEKKMESRKVKDGKFKDLVSQLLKKVGVEISDVKAENWVDIVTDLAWKAAIFLKPGADEGKAMDPSGYLKIKCVAVGSRGESRLIKGLVFKKHAAHKHMVTKYKKPRLLLIQGMLGPSSGSSGLSSFSSMIAEDQASQVNCDDLIQNLQACQPNVILVEKSASRDFMEKILQMGVTLVLDMKRDRLERVARCTNSPIFSSDTPFNQKLTHCESLYFEKLVEEHAIIGEGGKKPSKTLMFLEGCPTNFGCTILLKGSHGEELKKIKCVVQCAVVMAYHFLLETSFLVDQEAMFATIAVENAADISPTNELSAPVVSELSSGSYHGELDVGDSSAEGAQVLNSSGSVQEPSNVEEPTAHDIAVSYGDQEEKSYQAKEFTAKDAKMASPNRIDDKVSKTMQLAADSHCCEPRITSLSAVRSLSHALEKVSIVSPATYESMSPYIDLNGKEPESQTAVSIPVSPIEEPADHRNIEVSNNSKEDKTFNNDSRSVSISSTVDGEAKGPAEDGEESIRAKDEISSVLDSESILVLMSSRNVAKGTICEQSHFTHIKFYRNFDVPLGKFLREDLFDQGLKCEACGELPEAHYYYYAHHSKQLTIRVKRLGKKHLPRESEGKLWMWSRCSKCEPEKGKVTKRVLISKAARCLSFGKFLELSFSSHSTFNRPSSCGHSFQKDFLYFFGYGSMVAMFQYSRVAIYTVSVPAHKLEFSSSINKEWLEPEVRTVYTTGLFLFNELEKYLKKTEPQISGWNLILNGCSKGFSDIIDLLKLERSEFEENFNKKNVDSHDSVYKLLSLNRLRWEIFLEACVWDRRLESLLYSSSDPPQSTETGINEVAQRKMVLEEYDNPGEAEGSKTYAETGERHMLLEEQKSGSEREGTQKIADEAILEQMDSDKGQSDGTVEATAMVVERQTGSNTESAGDINLHGDERTHENCDDVDVQIEMVAEAENVSSKESPNDGILQGHKEQDLVSLPIVKEYTQSPPSCDSVPSVSLSQESNGSIPIKIDEENSNCSADGEVPERPSSPTLKLDSSLWNSFGQIREECMEDLLDGRPPKFGHLPKFERFHSPDFLPVVSQVIIEEGSRLHMPLRDGDYIVSEFDGEISSYIAFALARTENSSQPSSDNDENITLKRAASEPWPLSGTHDPDLMHSSASMTFTDSHLANYDGSNRSDSVVSNGRVYKEVNIGFDNYPTKGKHSIVIIYPNEFRSLRRRCCPSELDYIASLSRCKIWDAKGGKSKSVFAKTLDERLIIKEIKKTEFDSFMKFAPAYFRHMTVSVDSGNQTCLAKILGLYQVTIRNPKSGKETKHDLMVQENLSFGRNITRQYDLKGALRARFTEIADGAGDVLLDQNFVKDMKSSPLYIGQKYKRLLQRAVWNDTTFLNNIGVMDYSLLVGVDRKRRDLVCGIIDYLRQYTWDKQFETWVKSSLAPKSDAPTIISPQEYKKRFRKFMDTHFLTVPDDWCFHRSSNPCKLCGAKVHDSSIAKLQKGVEELHNVQAHDL